jgi:plasmid stabilization system protein ParE
VPIINVPLDVPADILAALATGELTRYGSVVRNQAGAIVMHLKDGMSSPPAQEAVAKVAALARKNSRFLLLGLGVAAATAVGVAVYKAVTADQKSAEDAPECVQRFTTSLGAYLAAARDGRLGVDDVDRLIADLDTVKAESDSGRIAVDFAVDQWETLTRLVADHTRRLADANRIGTDDLRELQRRPDGDVIVDLRRYLEAQKRIFKNAA